MVVVLFPCSNSEEMWEGANSPGLARSAADRLWAAERTVLLLLETK